MAVVSVEEQWPGRNAEDGIERHRRATRVFHVRTDSASDSGYVAGGAGAAALGLPRNGESHPDDPAAFMVRIHPDQHDDDPCLWTITCDYDTELPIVQGQEALTIDSTGNSIATASGADPTARPESPLNRPAVWKVDFEASLEPITHDEVTGNPIVNAAGDPYIPPRMREVMRAVFVVTKNYSALAFDTVSSFAGAVNNAAYCGRIARSLRIAGLSYEPMQENNVAFYRATFRIKYKPGSWNGGASDTGQGWDMRIPNVGARKKTDLGGGSFRLDPISDEQTGLFPDGLVPLDHDGQPITDPATPITYMTYKEYPEADFTTLGLV